MTEPVRAEAIPAVGSRLEFLDYLRFAAAASVLCYHYFVNGVREGTIVGIGLTPFAQVAKYGFLGVELFFLISGFVIFASVQGKTARSFAVGRAVRLYPAFWVAVLLTAAVVTMWGGIIDVSVSPREVLVNFTMAPSVFRVDLVDGVYWTLLLELYFYVAVLAALLVGLGPRLGALLPWWIFGQLTILLLAEQYTAVPYLGDSFVLFALGALIAEIRRNGMTPVRGAAFAAGVFMACAWTVETTADAAVKNHYAYSDTVLVVTMLVFVALIASMWSRRVSALSLPRSREVGALTYPLYLVHAYIGYILLSEAAKILPAWAAYALAIAGVLLLAELIHVAVEKRPKRFWFRFFDGTVGRAVSLLEGLRSAPAPGTDRTEPRPSQTTGRRRA